MKKNNKFLSVILSLALIASNIIFSAVIFADGADSDNFINLFDEETGVVYQVPDEADEQMQLSANLTPLSKPTGLVWHKSNNNQTIMGNMAWNPVPNCEGEYRVSLKRNGYEVDSTNWGGLYDHDGDNLVCVSFVDDGVFDESGSYTFEVYAKGDGTVYSDSSVAVSPVYNFTAPSAKLAAPTNVRWTDDGHVLHDGVPNAGTYKYILYNQDDDTVGYTWNWSGTPGTSTQIDKDLSWYLIDLAGRGEDIRQVAVSVVAITYNIELYRNSSESARSGWYDIEGMGSSVSGSLGNVVDDLYNGNISASAALNNFLDEMDANDITNTDIAVSMLEDPDVVSDISYLENSFMAETGITSKVTDSAEDSGYLESRGIDVDKIEVVGAALNSTGSDVSINFSKADPNLSYDKLYYKNSVAVNIGIDGVHNSQNLDVPIQITMPVPAGVLPERLVILHYHADGSVEEIRPVVFNSANGETLLKFVLTSFSPFVFCNISDGDSVETGSISVVSTEALIGGSVEVNIEIGANPGIAAIRFGLEYDDDTFVFNSVSYGDIMGEENFVEGNPESNPYMIVAYNAQADDDTTGVLATLTFNVDPDADLDVFEFSIVDFEACDIYENDVEFDITNGFVSVYKPIPPTIEITPVISGDGETVCAYFEFVKNPGVAIFGFDLVYDSNVVSVEKLTNGVVFPDTNVTAGNKAANPYQFLAYNAASDMTGDGIFYVLEFKLKNGASINDITDYPFILENLEAYDLYENVIDFEIVNNPVCSYGDVNRDGVVNRLDLLRLAKHFSGYDVDVFAPAADVMINAVVDRADLLRLAKHVSGWDDAILGQSNS